MASFKGYDREDGQKRRQGQRKPRRNGIPRIEFLEKRQLLSGGRRFPRRSGRRSDPPTCSTPRMARWPTWGLARSTFTRRIANSGGNTSQLAADSPTIEFQNGMVGLQVKSLGGDFSQFETQLTDVGVQVTTASSYYGVVDGFAPDQRSCRRSRKCPRR